jgi:Ca2+-binding RTX toxin-like protein
MDASGLKGRTVASTWIGRRRRLVAASLPVLFCSSLLLVSDVHASAASPDLQCRGARVTIRGTSGSDHLVGTSGADVIWGGSGSDVIRGRAGDDIVCGGSGADVITTGRGNDQIYAGYGNDYIEDSGAGRLTVKAGPGDDVVHDDGMALSDYSLLFGGTGNDYILGGGSEIPALIGGAGNDILRGRQAAEMITGRGHDIAIAGTDFSQASLTGDGDVYVGGPKEDAALYDAPGPVRVSLTTGRGQVIGQQTADTLINVDDVYGTDYDDELIGDASANHLAGFGGNDVLLGRAGPDILDGGEGDDTLDGGLPTGSSSDGDYLDGDFGTDHCTGGETTLNCE